MLHPCMPANLPLAGQCNITTLGRQQARFTLEQAEHYAAAAVRHQEPRNRSSLDVGVRHRRQSLRCTSELSAPQTSPALHNGDHHAHSAGRGDCPYRLALRQAADGVRLRCRGAADTGGASHVSAMAGVGVDDNARFLIVCSYQPAMCNPVFIAGMLRMQCVWRSHSSIMGSAAWALCAV